MSRCVEIPGQIHTQLQNEIRNLCCVILLGNDYNDHYWVWGYPSYSTSERLYSCFVILCGSIMFAVIKVTKLIINRNPQATNLKAKMDDLKGYLNERT